MSLFETTYKNTLYQIEEKGVWTMNRTGVDTRFIPAAMIQADLREGFPALTLRKIPTKAGISEAIAFLRGYDKVEQFESLGCNFWRANADETPAWLASQYRQGSGDLGRIYGVQWRKFPAMVGGGLDIDQIRELVTGLLHNPSSRRHVVTSWHPETVRENMAALPPCHDSWTVTVDTWNNQMHLSWRQRSTDLILGTPHNTTCYAFILSLLARLTGRTAGFLTAHLDNVHIYENHMHSWPLLTLAESKPLAQIKFADTVPSNLTTVDEIMHVINTISPDDVSVQGYTSHPTIPDLKMAV